MNPEYINSNNNVENNVENNADNNADIKIYIDTYENDDPDNEFYIEFDDDAETMIVTTKEEIDNKNNIIDVTSYVNIHENHDKISDIISDDSVDSADSADENDIMFLEINENTQINKLSDSDLIIIEQIEFLINKGYIPQYLYPPNDMIHDDYIKLISNYLYRIYIYKKLYSENYKKNKQSYYKSPSKLRKCTTPDDLQKQYYISIHHELKLIDEMCEKMLEISVKYKEYNQHDDFIV